MYVVRDLSTYDVKVYDVLGVLHFKSLVFPGYDVSNDIFFISVLQFIVP